MLTYILLRNNKESGPLSLEELVRIGLKPYDLIWVNGKSAAWRYPGEIDELKQFAPMVEEQPYDRFYKKPSGQQTAESPVVKKEEPVSTSQQPVFTPKKSVFVKMPGQKTAASTQESKETMNIKKEPVTATPGISIQENPASAEVKYSQPLEEIKEMYVKTLLERKKKIAGKTSLTRNIKKITTALLIVGTGALIGYSLQQNLPGRPKAAAENNLANNPNASTEPEAVIASIPSAAPAAELLVEETIATHEPLDIPAATTPAIMEQKNSEKKIASRTKQETMVKENFQPIKKEIAIDEPSPGVDINTRTGERNRKVRTGDEETEEEILSKETGNPEPKAVYKGSQELSKLVTVTSNDYQRVAFGGIRNLQLTVHNESKYILDNVLVELQYLKPSEQPFRTEQIEFRSVAPGGTMTIRVPDTNRGIKVLYRITNILSTQSAKETAGL